MAAGYSRVRIFNNRGIQLTEIDVATKRSWVLNEPGRCQFTYNIYDAPSRGFNPKLTGYNFAYGNFILIEHKPSKNADGTTNGILPVWCGFISPPQQWSYGKVQVTAMQAEFILQLRATPMDLSASGSPGQIFSQILAWANDQSFNPGGFPVQPGMIDLSGAPDSRVMKVSALEEVRALYKASGYEWDIQPVLNSKNQLSLVANWYVYKGVRVFRYFTNVNLQASDPIYSESGQYYNTIRSFSEASSTGNRNFSLVQDAASVLKNGLANENLVWPGTSGAVSAVGTDVVINKANNFIATNKTPVRTFGPQVLDSGNDFSYLNVGNFWNVQTDLCGFLPNGQIGTNGLVRITAMEYDDLKNAVLMAAVLQ